MTIAIVWTGLSFILLRYGDREVAPEPLSREQLDARFNDGNRDEQVWFRRAAESASIAGYSLSKVQRWLHEVALKKIDRDTGLYRADGHWNYWDTAADCYPYLVWASYVVDDQALDGPVRNVLHAEMKLCNSMGRIPAPYDFKKGARDDSVPHDKLFYGASEYVKDGLIPIVEITGKDEWFERMKGIVEDIWKYAPVDTPYGMIPSTNVEVNGEQLQALVRLYAMTGQRKFLAWAERIADYYLGRDDFVPNRLRDHGCEIIGGLGLLLGIESQVSPEKARDYQVAIRRMFDVVLSRGTNADGIMYNFLDNSDGRLSDTWGYNYVAYLCFDKVVGRPVYRERIARTLRNLGEARYKDYRWEGLSIDGFGDSIEGAIYLLNRVPIPQTFAWVDREMANNVIRSNEPLETAQLWHTGKLESNGVRTVVMHALMHTRGLIARPWRDDLTLGACDKGDSLAVVMGAKKDWSGTLVFDVPRHRLYLGFNYDWPRINTLPEWFTVELDKRYAIGGEESMPRKEYSGKELHEGLPVKLQAGKELRLLVSPVPSQEAAQEHN